MVSKTVVQRLSLRSFHTLSHAPYNGLTKTKVFTSPLVVLSHFPLEKALKMRFGVMWCQWMHAMSFWGDLGSLIGEFSMMAE